MPRISLTARSVKSLKPPESGQVDYWDASLPRFGVRLSQGGSRTWIAMYRVGSRKRRQRIGTNPPMELSEARVEAKSILAAAQKGEDPALDIILKRQAKTFAHLAKRYLDEHAKPNKKSWRLDEKALDRDVIPSLGTRLAQDVTRRDIRELINGIKAPGSPIQANRTIEIVRKLCNWAVSQDHLASNPCDGIRKPAKENRRDRVLRNDEIVAVWETFEAESPLVAAIFKLRLITAQRGGEITSMRWQDIEFSTSWWTIPAERAKEQLGASRSFERARPGIVEERPGERRGFAVGVPQPDTRPPLGVSCPSHAPNL